MSRAIPSLSCLYFCCHGIVASDDDQAYSETAIVFLLAYIYFCFIGIKRQDLSLWSGSLYITLCYHFIPLPWHSLQPSFLAGLFRSLALPGGLCVTVMHREVLERRWSSKILFFSLCRVVGGIYVFIEGMPRLRNQWYWYAENSQEKPDLGNIYRDWFYVIMVHGFMIFLSLSYKREYYFETWYSWSWWIGRSTPMP